MSGETEKDVSGWTTDTLKHYVDALFAEKEKALQSALASAKEAVHVQTVAAEQWRAQANEWRGAMTDREKTFATVVQVQAHDLRLKALETAQQHDTGREAGMRMTGGFLVATVSVAVTLIIVAIAVANYVSGSG